MDTPHKASHSPNAPARAARVLTEKQFQALIVELGTLYGWKIYHPWLSIKSSQGFPDLVLTRAGDPVVFVECKRDRGKVTPAQAAWLEALRQAKGCECYLWTPNQWPEIAARLQRPRAQGIPAPIGTP